MSSLRFPKTGKSLRNNYVHNIYMYNIKNKSHNRLKCFLSKNMTVSRDLCYPFSKHVSTLVPEAQQLLKIYIIQAIWFDPKLDLPYHWSNMNVFIFHLKWKGVRSILTLWFLPLTLTLLQIALRHIFSFNTLSQMQMFNSSYCSTLYNQEEMPPSY